MKVYIIFGQEVATMVKDHEDAGYYTVVWDTMGIASGIYFYTIEAGELQRD